MGKRIRVSRPRVSGRMFDVSTAWLLGTAHSMTLSSGLSRSAGPDLPPELTLRLASCRAARISFRVASSIQPAHRGSTVWTRYVSEHLEGLGGVDRPDCL